jgi:hypothetical protein
MLHSVFPFPQSFVVTLNPERFSNSSLEIDSSAKVTHLVVTLPSPSRTISAARLPPPWAATGWANSTASASNRSGIKIQRDRRTCILSHTF